MRSVLLLTCLFISAMLAGCGGSHAKYYANHPLIGVRTTFKEPMAYVTNLPDMYGDQEIIRINRSIEPLDVWSRTSKSSR